jgi:acetyl-CoA acetyltransferase
MPLRDVAVAGVYTTRQARTIDDRTSFELTLEAVQGALSDAGLSVDDVDGSSISFPGPGGVAGDSGSWARIFGHRLAYISDGLLDTSGARGVMKAAAAISAGLCEVAVVGGASAVGTFVPGGGLPGEVEQQFSFGSGGAAISSGDVWGSYVAANFALAAQRHMYEFGTTKEQLGIVAASIRNHGNVNPDAVMYGRGPYTPADIAASRPVASPFNLLDICLVAQGGAAIVLTTSKRAADLPQPRILLLGAAMEVARGAWTGGSSYRDCRQLGADAAQRMYSMADARPEDTDVYCFYDPTSFEVIHCFEVLGLCGEGEGGPFVADNGVSLGGKFPVNPDGGCLSYSWNGTQQMTMKLIECVKQLRGQATGRQVDDCELAVATNAGSASMHIEMALLGRG